MGEIVGLDVVGAVVGLDVGPPVGPVVLDVGPPVGLVVLDVGPPVGLVVLDVGPPVGPVVLDVGPPVGLVVGATVGVDSKLVLSSGFPGLSCRLHAACGPKSASRPRDRAKG